MGMPVPRRKKAAKKRIKLWTFDECKAKSCPDGSMGMTVWEHSLIVAQLSRFLYKFLPRSKRKFILPGYELLAGLHDLGKISPGFQVRIWRDLMKIQDPLLYAKRGAFDEIHPRISESAFLEFFKGIEGVESLAAILGMHHGWRDEEPLPHRSALYGDKHWRRLRAELLGRMLQEFPDHGLVSGGTSIQSEITGALICLSDWMGSDEDNFDPKGGHKAVNRRASATIKRIWKRSTFREGLKFSDLFFDVDKKGKKHRYRPNQTQRKFYAAVDKPGTYILEAPMGLGKTEAALWAAYKLVSEGHNEGIYFALPTRLTSNKIHERITPFLEAAVEKGTAPRLIHGHAWLEDHHKTGGELEPGGAWFSPNRKAILMDFGVGTVDQILLGILHVKYHFIRRLGLAGKVVILDEVHSYDAYTSELLVKAVKWLREMGCTVIILSATLTHNTKKALLDRKTLKRVDSYPLITAQTGKLPRFIPVKPPAPLEYDIKMTRAKRAPLMRYAIRAAKKGANVLWIENTVNEAVSAYQFMLPRLTKRTECGLLHSRFPAAARTKREGYWIDKLGKRGDRTNGSILVATQVVEQSVDIDADLLITDIAPSDMLIQRIGRVWRHLKVFPANTRPIPKPIVLVRCPALSKVKDEKAFRNKFDNNTALIYAPFVLRQTQRIWKSLSTITIPTDIRTILEQTYRDADKRNTQWVIDLWKKFCNSQWVQRLSAFGATGTQLQIREDDEDVSYVTRRLSVPTVPVVLFSQYSEGKKYVHATLLSGEKIKKELDSNDRDYFTSRSLHHHLVKVPQTKILGDEVMRRDALRAKLSNGKHWIDRYMYGGSVPVVIDNGSMYLADKRKTLTEYHYEDDCGAYK